MAANHPATIPALTLAAIVAVTSVRADEASLLRYQALTGPAGVAERGAAAPAGPRVQGAFFGWPEVGYTWAAPPRPDWRKPADPRPVALRPALPHLETDRPAWNRPAVEKPTLVRPRLQPPPLVPPTVLRPGVEKPGYAASRPGYRPPPLTSRPAFAWSSPAVPSYGREPIQPPAWHPPLVESPAYAPPHVNPPQAIPPPVIRP